MPAKGGAKRHAHSINTNDKDLRPNHPHDASRRIEFDNSPIRQQLHLPAHQPSPQVHTPAIQPHFTRILQA